MIKKTFILVREKLPYFFAGIFLEIMFVFAYGLAAQPVSNKISEYIIIIGTMYARSINSAKQSIFQAMLSEPIKPYFLKLLLLFFILIAAAYFAYCTFQGFTWVIAHRIAKNKVKFFDYMIIFFKMNILWVLLYAAYFLLSWVADTNFVIATILTQGHAHSFSFLEFFARIFRIALIYFAAISYVLLSNKKAFSFGKQKIRKLIPACLIIAAYFFAINYAVIALTGINPNLGTAAGFILLFPALIFAKVYLILTIQKANKAI